MRTNKLTAALVAALFLASISSYAGVKEPVFVPENQQVIGHKTIAFDDYATPKTKQEFRDSIAKSLDGDCQFEAGISSNDFISAGGIKGAENPGMGLIRFSAQGTCNGIKVFGIGQISYYQSKEKDKYTTSKLGEIFYQDRDANYATYLSRYIGHYPANSEEFTKAETISKIDLANRKLAVESCTNKYSYSQEYTEYRSCVESEAELNNSSLSSDAGSLFMRSLAAVAPSYAADIDAEKNKYQNKCFGLELTIGQLRSTSLNNISSLSEICKPVGDEK
jgi:hypothetical protein